MIHQQMHQAMLQHLLVIHLLFHGAVKNSRHILNCLFYMFGHEFWGTTTSENHHDKLQDPKAPALCFHPVACPLSLAMEVHNEVLPFPPTLLFSDAMQEMPFYKSTTSGWDLESNFLFT